MTTKRLIFLSIGLCLYLLAQISTKANTESKLDLYAGKAATYEKKGKYKRALRLYKKIEAKSVPLVKKANAILAQGRCQEKMGNKWKSYLQYQKAVDNYASFIPYIEILKLEYDIANKYFSGEKDKFLFFSFSNYSKAIEIYDHITVAAPYSPFTVDAIYRSGLLSMKTKNNEDAAEKFRTIIRRYTTSAKVNDAKIQLADALLRSANEADADGTLVEEAHRVLTTINYNKLTPSRAEEAKNLLHITRSMKGERFLYLAEFHQRSAHLRNNASKRYIHQILEKYSDTESFDRAKELLAVIERKDSASPATKN